MRGQKQYSVVELVFSLLCLAVSSTAIAEPAVDLCAISSLALTRASDIRGLSVLKAVPCVSQDKAQVREFLDETIRTELPPSKMEMEQLAYRAIGMISDDYDYGKSLVSFLVSQLGGYYDPKRERFVMAAWLPSSVQETVAVHELTHALQDQHYDLKKFLHGRSDNGDRSLAYSALIEGDATAVMLDNDRRLKHMPQLEKEQSIESSILMQILGMNIGGGGVPESLKAMLIFPYTSGLRFVHAILRVKGYKGLEEAYQRPPQSTREILHPEEYLSGQIHLEIPTEADLTLGEPQRDKPDAIEYSDVIGEFGIASLFSNSAVAADARTRASVGWKGDRLVVYAKRDGHRLVRWLTRWESERDAEEFHEAYSSFIGDRYKTRLGSGETTLSDAKSIEITANAREVFVQFRQKL
jgi:hypothetical protein